MPYPILIRNNPGGAAHAPPLDLADALVGTFAFDAHTVQYEGSLRRNKESVTAENPLVLSCELYDFDNKSLPDAAREAWALDCLSKLPPGFVGYRTSGGFRAVTLREPFTVATPEDWEAWRQHHGGRAEALGQLLGAEPDHSTDEPNRLFRLPGAKRDDDKPSYPDLFGEIDYASLAPAPYERRRASAVYTDGDARHSKVGAAFQAAGLVQRTDGQKLVVTCPWVHEHSGKNPSGTFVDDTEDHFGHFVCSHSHCQHRHSLEALAALGGLPAVSAELSKWPEPKDILTPYSRQESAPAPVSEVSAVVTTSSWLSGADLLRPIGEVNWLVKELELAPGRSPLLCADAGAGKSWSVQSIALSVATGLPVFGAFECRKGPVFHIAEDSDIDSVLDRYQRLARGMNVDLGALDLAVYSKSFRVVGNKRNYMPEKIAEIKEMARKNGAGLVIIDSLATVCVGLEENSPEIALPLYDTRDTQTTFLWTHHTNKGGDSYRGSSALKAAAGAMWGITKEGDVRRWTNEKHAERTSVKERLADFTTQWDGQKIIVTGREANVTHSERACDRMQLAMLRLVSRDGKANKAGLIRAAGGTGGRNATMAKAVFDFLANPLAPQLTEVSTNKWILAAGVTVPEHAHQLQNVLPQEIATELNKKGRKP